MLKIFQNAFSKLFPEPKWWNKTLYSVPNICFGSGCLDDFSYYFSQKSTVKVQNVAALCDWLKDCSCLNDEANFGFMDTWQHPVEFEHMRKGDCEDHALWAWRKLKEMGINAEFVVGLVGIKNDKYGHAWVHFA